MSNYTYRTKVELGVMVVTILIGGFIAFNAWQINPESYEAVGPRFVPMFLAVSMMIGGLLIGGLALLQNDKEEEDDGMYIEEKYGFQDAQVSRVFLVIGCGFIYVALFYALGYFLSTMISLVLMVLAFGNRTLGRVLIFPVVATFVYQYVFMGLMGVHDPEGILVNIKPFTNIISGQ